MGITEENGQGEVVGGIVVMRYGENAKEVIDRVKARLGDVEMGLPSGVKFKVAYDRSDLIEAAIATLKEALWEEILIVSIVVMIFISFLFADWYCRWCLKSMLGDCEKLLKQREQSGQLEHAATIHN